MRLQLQTEDFGDGVVTNAKRTDMPEATVSGRPAGAGTGPRVELTAAQLIAIIGSSSGSMSALPIYENGVFEVNATEIDFTGQVVVTHSGTTAYVSVTGTGGSSGEPLHIDQSAGTSGTYGTVMGDIDGANTLFYVSAGAYSSGGLIVALNGQILTQGVSEDWVENTPLDGGFEILIPPISGDVITAIYGGSGGGGGGSGDMLKATYDPQNIGADAFDLGNQTGALPQSQSHDSPDTDVSATSLHHTLGAGQYQAAPGNHTHPASVPYWVEYNPLTSPGTTGTYSEYWDDTVGMSGPVNGINSGTWQLVGSAQTLYIESGFLVMRGDAPGAPNVTGIRHAIPATPFTVTCKVTIERTPNYNVVHMGFIDDAGKMWLPCILLVGQVPSVEVHKFSSPTNLTGNTGSLVAPMAREAWLRIEDDGANCKAYFSVSGLEHSFELIYSESYASAGLTPTGYVLALDAYSAAIPVASFGPTIVG